MKRTIEKEIAASCSQLVLSQETMLAKQEIAAEKVQRLTDIVQDIRRERKRVRRSLFEIIHFIKR